MKLTENTLRALVKEVLKEDHLPFPPPPDEETVDDAIEMEEKSTGPIIRFYESDEKDEDEDGVDESCKDDREIIVGEDDGIEESLSLDDIVQEEIAKYVEVKKKIISP